MPPEEEQEMPKIGDAIDPESARLLPAKPHEIANLVNSLSGELRLRRPEPKPKKSAK